MTEGFLDGQISPRHCVHYRASWQACFFPQCQVLFNICTTEKEKPTQHHLSQRPHRLELGCNCHSEITDMGGTDEWGAWSKKTLRGKYWGNEYFTERITNLARSQLHKTKNKTSGSLILRVGIDGFHQEAPFNMSVSGSPFPTWDCWNADADLPSFPPWGR